MHLRSKAVGFCRSAHDSGVAMKALASVKAVVLSQRSLWDRDLQMDSPLLEGVEKVGFAALHGVLKDAFV